MSSNLDLKEITIFLFVKVIPNYINRRVLRGKTGAKIPQHGMDRGFISFFESLRDGNDTNSHSLLEAKSFGDRMLGKYY